MCDRDIEIQKHCEKFKNTLVLDYDRVVILRDWIEQEDDFYYIFQTLDGERYESSCALWFIPLKGSLAEIEYEVLRNHFQINLDKLNEQIC